MTTNGLHHKVASRAELELDRGMQAADRIAKQAEAGAALVREDAERRIAELQRSLTAAGVKVVRVAAPAPTRGSEQEPLRRG